jgi:hypothetical protein
MMHELRAVDGSPLAPESLQMLEYLRTRAAEMNAAAIRARIGTAAHDLEEMVAAVSAAHARLRPFPGRWTIAEVVDHMAQTNVRAAEELRHLLAGRRPPHPPVYEALRSGAGQWAPWDLLVEELRGANRAMLEAIEGAPDEATTASAPTVKTVMVARRKIQNGKEEPQIFFAELHWKEYALLQRLHLLDHRRQIKELCAASASA